MKIFGNGIVTGLVLQIAVGPVFFFIANLTLQGNIFNGLAGVIAATAVDYLYIALAIFGVGKLLTSEKNKKVFEIISYIVLAIFGMLIIKSVLGIGVLSATNIVKESSLTSFISVFVLTISNPMTIIFFTSLFTAKAFEYGYKRNDLLIFGFGTGFATFIFMGVSVILFSLVRSNIPILLIQILNIIVGCLLVGYGIIRLFSCLYPRVYRRKKYRPNS